jgi:1,4-alpha-glucan branching enzyme
MSGEDSSHVVRVRAPACERVEIMADFTQWEPVQLVRTPNGFWEVTLPMRPGPHRINVRLDGGDWVVPTNVARVTDDFGGVVGLLIVR